MKKFDMHWEERLYHVLPFLRLIKIALMLVVLAFIWVPPAFKWVKKKVWK